MYYNVEAAQLGQSVELNIGIHISPINQHINNLFMGPSDVSSNKWR